MTVKITLAATLAALLFTGCGGGSSSNGSFAPSSGTTPIPTINVVAEDDISSFLRESYAQKDKYETTEEYETRKAETLSEIKNTTLFKSGMGFAYDADSEIGTYTVRFSHTQDGKLPNLINSGNSYEVYDYSFSNQWAHGYVSHEYVFSNLYSSDEIRAEKGNVDCNNDGWDGAIICKVEFYATPDEARNINIGLKLSIDIDSLEMETKTYQFSADTSKMEYNYYPSKFVNFIIYDEATDKELAKLVL